MPFTCGFVIKKSAQLLVCGMVALTIVGCAQLTTLLSKSEPLGSGSISTEKRVMQEGQNTSATMGYMYTSASEEITEPSWNIWLDHGGETQEVLQISKAYELVLDLSRYRYVNHLGTTASPEVLKMIDQNRDHEWLRFIVRPFSLDSKIKITKHEDGLKARLDRLSGAPDSDERKLLEQFRGNKLKLSEFAKSVSAGEIRFKLVPTEPGCAVMALSIWDETGIVPLDHLVVSLPVAEPNKPAPPCGSTDVPYITVAQGVGPLLRIALDRSADEPPPVASISMFETEVLGELHTAVILIERKLYENSRGRKGLHTWVTEGLISNYLADPDQLLAQLNVARDSLDGRSRHRHRYPYAAMARELDTKLFSQFQGPEKVAMYARRALHRSVNTAEEESPTVLVRAVDSQNKRFLVPLGLLAARDEAAVFTKQMTVITPLPVERYPASACIDTWTLAVPTSLEADDESPARLSEAKKLVGFARIKTETELKEYMGSEIKYLASSNSVNATPSRAQALILLSHHSPNFIWFNDRSERVATENLKREFPSGSVAVFAACSTASAKGDYQAWLTKLNEHGIDAMVVSPFPVLTEYSTHFALNFGLAAQSARNMNKRSSFLELFRTASRATSDKFKAKYGEGTAFNEMALEFVVAGDSSIRMCANP